MGPGTWGELEEGFEQGILKTEILREKKTILELMHFGCTSGEQRVVVVENWEENDSNSDEIFLADNLFVPD